MNSDEITSMAEEERRVHAGRIAIAMEMRKRLGLDVYGYFAKDREKIVSGELEPAYSAALRGEHDMACSYGASMEWAVEALNRQTLINKEEMAAKEDLATYLFECESRQHTRAGNGDIRWAIFDTLQTYGMLVGFDAIDFDDDECGLRMRMIDPATVFPIFEGNRGMGGLYRIYYATAGQMIGDFGAADGKLERAIKKIARAGNVQYDPTYMGEVIEYWDRHRMTLLFEGEEVLHKVHGYARVPFTITYGSFGQQGFTRTSDHYFVDGTTIVVSSGAGNTRMRSEDLMRTAQPFLWWRTKLHDIEEALSGLMIQAFRRSIDPPVVHYRSLLSIGQGAIRVNRSESGYTAASEDDKIEAFPTSPTPEVINPLMAYLTQNRTLSTPSGVLSGQMPAAQTSGSALDILGSMGFQKWYPLIMTVEQFLTERTEARLALYRDYGDVLGDPAELGTTRVPRRKPNPRTGNASAHEVTSQMLKNTGIRVKVTLRRFDPISLGPVANGLQILQSMGVIDRRRIIKVAGFDPDPDAVLQDVDFDELYAAPEVKQEKVLRMLKTARDQAEAQGDWESVIDVEKAMLFIASEMERRAMIGQPTLGPDGQRINQPGGGGGNMQVQGLSMPQFGIPTGTSGGRPMGS